MKRTKLVSLVLVGVLGNAGSAWAHLGDDTATSTPVVQPDAHAAAPGSAVAPPKLPGKRVAQLSLNQLEQSTGGKKPKAGVVAKAPVKLGGALLYTNYFSALAPSDFERVYGMSLALAPRYRLTPSMSIGGQLAVDLELTDSNATTYNREPWFSDTRLDWWWLGAKIPVVGVQVGATAAVILPTSKISQARSLLFALRPGLNFSRSFKLRQGDFLRSLSLRWDFMPTKFFNEYTTAQLDAVGGCANTMRPECMHSGFRNPSWQIANGVTVTLAVHRKVWVSLVGGVINQFKYAGGAQQKELADGTIIDIPAADGGHVAITTAALDVTVPVYRWLVLSLGLSSFHNQLTPDSSYRFPLLNQFTSFYFTINLPLGGLYEQFRG